MPVSNTRVQAIPVPSLGSLNCFVAGFDGGSELLFQRIGFDLRSGMISLQLRNHGALSILIPINRRPSISQLRPECLQF